VVFEGGIRKWFFPGAQQQIYFIKDALLILAYLGFLRDRPPYGEHVKAMAGLKVILALSLVYLGIELFNPNSPSLLLSVFGFKNYLLYVPLAFVVPYMFSSSADLERKLRKYAVLMIPFAALGLVQFAFPPDHWINGYLSNDSENLRRASMFGAGELEHARTSGTFSFTGGFTTFLLAIFFLAAGLATYRKWRISGNLLPLALLVITSAAMFTTGSRTPIYSIVITLPLMLFIWKVGGLVSGGALLRISAVWMIMSVAVLLISSGAIEAYQYRASHADDPTMRVLAPLSEVYDALGQTPVMGTGMATTSGAAITITGTSSFWWLQGVFVETEQARVLQEIGIIGFILIYAARAWLVIKAITLSARFRSPLHVAIGGGLAAFLAQSSYGIIINNPTAGIYYWFAVGLLFAMCRLELQEFAVSSRASNATQLGRYRLNAGRRSAPLAGA
jgi:hypothetical protein